MEYKFLKHRGALAEDKRTATASPPMSSRSSDTLTIAGFTPRFSAKTSFSWKAIEEILCDVPRELIAIFPESMAREHKICPIADDGTTMFVATIHPDDVALADKIGFMLNRTVHLVPASQKSIHKALNKSYGDAADESVDSMIVEFTDTQIDVSGLHDRDEDHDLAILAAEEEREAHRRRAHRVQRGKVDFKKGKSRAGSYSAFGMPAPRTNNKYSTPLGGYTMFSYVVEEGQKVLMRKPDGTMEILVGPTKVSRFRRIFRQMPHHVAHPGEFLIVRYRDGRQEHIPGPTELWEDPRIHEDIRREDALQIANREAVVVYSRPDENAEEISRRIVHGPALFVPEPGEWLHTFSWHGSKGGSKGIDKTANSLVFQKLWMLPDQMYHDIRDVRTADDAVLTIRLMIFFELLDIEKMLETTHDPIGDFVNAATSDVVGFTGRHDFESFKQNTSELNELATYKQLTNRAEQCGYRINKVVYRGYGAPDALQQMHNQAIEARTRLQLERANEQQAQDLENYKLDCQLDRAGKRRSEQSTEVEHDLTIAGKKQAADREQKEAWYQQLLDRRRREKDQLLELESRQHQQEREQLSALKDMGVDLTAYLTQSRADRVIELRGGNGTGTHLHLDQNATNTANNRMAKNGE